MSARHRWIVFALFLVEVAANFESSMVFAALPKLMAEFGDVVLVGWLVTVHGLVATAATLLVGRIGELHGVRRIMLVVLALAAMGSLLSAVSGNFAVLLAGRSIQALCAAALPLAIGLVRATLPPDKVPSGVGMITSGAAGGAAGGLVLGGVIVDNLDWRWIFAASFILLVLSWVAVRACIPEQPRRALPVRVNWFEGLLPIPGIVAILLVISYAPRLGFTDGRVLALLGGGAVILAAWVRTTLRSPEPFVNLRLLAVRQVAVANVISVLTALGTMQIILVFSTYMQAPRWTMAGLGLSATLAGMAKLPSNVLSLFAGPFSGWLSHRAGNRAALVAGAALVSAGWCAALTLPETLPAMIVLICAISFGTTMLFAAIPNSIVAAVPEERVSEMIGSMIVIRGLFMSIGAQIVLVLLATQTVSHGTAVFPSQTGFRIAIAWILALSAAAALAGLFFLGRSSPAGEPGHAAGRPSAPRA